MYSSLPQVCKRDGRYFRVPLVEGGILVNIGDLLQRWTSDLYIATVSIVRQYNQAQANTSLNPTLPPKLALSTKIPQEPTTEQKPWDFHIKPAVKQKKFTQPLLA